MKWEYACLRRRRIFGSAESWFHVFYGPDGQTEIREANSVVVLNQLGQESWDAFGVETVRYSDEEVFDIWMKRPLNASS